MSYSGRMAQTEVITLGGGCFWCLEAVFKQMKGVSGAVSGYMGGHVDNPTYKDVCMGTTGHAEVVQVTFDPAIASLSDILHVFFTIHDPTTLNRQGNDSGTQYRSAIYFHTPEQESVSREVMREIERSGIWDGMVVTELTAAGHFYPAENYHQDYYFNNGYQPYCQFVVAPKVRKFREKFADRFIPFSS